MGDYTAPWIFGGVDSPIIQPAKQREQTTRDDAEDLNYLNDFFHNTKIMEEQDLRVIMKEKATKHRNYYRSLVESVETHDAGSRASVVGHGEALPVLKPAEDEIPTDENEIERDPSSPDIFESVKESLKIRQRKRGVFELDTTTETSSEFKSVKELREKYQAMLDKTQKSLSLGVKEAIAVDEDKNELLVPPSSGYCSSSVSGTSDDEKDKTWFPKNAIRRSASSDSAVHSDEDGNLASNWGEKREFTTGEGKILHNIPNLLVII